MLINGQRALAYVVTVDDVTPIDGADNIELARVGGWNVIVRKQEYHPGDKAVFCEIDSLLPDVEWSQFLAPKHFKVKTYKLGKFGVVSQGLLLPMGILPDNCCKDVHSDVTDVLGIKYYIAEDNERKASKPDKDAKYKAMSARCKNLAKYRWYRWLMRHDWGKKTLFLFFGRSVDKPKRYPDWIQKTDEERWANLPQIFEDDSTYEVSEKIDGTSATYFIDKTKRKPEFGVCSRNVRLTYEPRDLYCDGRKTGTSAHWEMYYKYHIEDVLERIARTQCARRVVIQGEIYGPSIQGNPLKVNERNFAAFNLIIDGRRLTSTAARQILADRGVPFVPILDKYYVVPKDRDEFAKSADGMSAINPKCRREGLVYRKVDHRCPDGIFSFKNVSQEYLLKLKD